MAEHTTGGPNPDPEVGEYVNKLRVLLRIVENLALDNQNDEEVQQAKSRLNDYLSRVQEFDRHNVEFTPENRQRLEALYAGVRTDIERLLERLREESGRLKDLADMPPPPHVPNPDRLQSLKGKLSVDLLKKAAIIGFVIKRLEDLLEGMFTPDETPNPVSAAAELIQDIVKLWALKEVIENAGDVASALSTPTYKANGKILGSSGDGPDGPATGGPSGNYPQGPVGPDLNGGGLALDVPYTFDPGQPQVSQLAVSPAQPNVIDIESKIANQKEASVVDAKFGELLAAKREDLRAPDNQSNQMGDAPAQTSGRRRDSVEAGRENFEQIQDSQLRPQPRRDRDVQKQPVAELGPGVTYGDNLKFENIFEAAATIAFEQAQRELRNKAGRELGDKVLADAASHRPVPQSPAEGRGL